MSVEKIQLGVTTIKELLDNGYTWLKKDDLGYGSIQEKFLASDMQIAVIRKHPLLKDLETTARIFIIIDDTNERTTTLSVDDSENAEPVERVPSNVPSSRTQHGSTSEDEVPGIFGAGVSEFPSSGKTTTPEPATTQESADAFFNI